MTNVGEDVEKRGCMYPASGNVNWNRHYGKQYASFITKKITTIISRNPIYVYTSKGIEI